MKEYQKRIGFLVSYQTLIPHGGIGQFTKSFCELMSQYNIKVDIITDKKPQDNDFIKTITDMGATLIYPDESLPYTTHSAIFMYGDSYCYERMANFRNAIVKAFTYNLYDALICNTYETVQVASTMGIDDCVQIIAYTHLESQIFKDTSNPFLHNVNEMMRLQLQMSNITIGTQSKFNQLQFDNAVHLPIPLPEKELLFEHHNDREGVLFIGRWEEGKNPELYLELIKQTKLPARVMTNANGAKKFEAKLKEIGVPYELGVGIIGKEKVDFIVKSRVAFNPSIVESYGIAFLEQITQLPTVVLEKQRWTENFNSDYYFTCNKKNMSEVVTKLYHEYYTAAKWYNSGSLAHTQAMESTVFHKWNHCFNDFTVLESNNSTAAICQETTISYRDFVKKLNRETICIDDIRSILRNKHKFRVIHTDTNTYLTKDPEWEPVEEESGLALFEGF